jgi:hypothetical protein
MRKKQTKVTVFKTVAKPVTIEFETKSGKTISIKAIRTYQVKRTVRARPKR